MSMPTKQRQLLGWASHRAPWGVVCLFDRKIYPPDSPNRTGYAYMVRGQGGLPPTKFGSTPPARFSGLCTMYEGTYTYIKPMSAKVILMW